MEPRHTMKYDVLAEYTVWYRVGTVEAESPEQARRLAASIDAPMMAGDDLGEPHDLPERASNVLDVVEQ